MSTTDIVLIIMIGLAVIFALCDEFLLPRRYGPTQLQVPLTRVNRLDSLIFIGLVVILIYQNINNAGTVLTTTLLLCLIAMAIYLSYIRRPKLLFKSTGFVYAYLFFSYSRIKNMNLSEDGILVFELENRQLLIRVQQLDDLERIYNFMIDNQ